MNKIIGGLLVVSLLTRPSVINIEYMAYELFYKDNKIVCVMKNDAEKRKQQKDIGKKVDDIDSDTRTVLHLLKEKRIVTEKIHAKLDLFRYAKVQLNQQQMERYASFMEHLQDNNQQVSRILQKVQDNKDLTRFKKEILHTDNNYDEIYNDLQVIYEHQQEAIVYLNQIIEEGNEVLSLL